MTAAKKLKMMLFDWNGTLIDDIHIVHDCLVGEIFRIFGQEPPPLEIYYQGFSGSAIDFFRNSGIVITKEEINKIFLGCYLTRVAGAELFPGAIETIDKLKNSDLIIGLVTGQNAAASLPLLYDRFQIGSRFRYTVFESFHKESSIRNLLAMAKIEPDECCYVGDSPSDVRHAKKAGVVSVGFANGKVPLELLMKERPMFIIDRLENLLNFVSFYETGVMTGPP